MGLSTVGRAIVEPPPIQIDMELSPEGRAIVEAVKVEFSLHTDQILQHLTDKFDVKLQAVEQQVVELQNEVAEINRTTKFECENLKVQLTKFSSN